MKKNKIFIIVIIVILIILGTIAGIMYLKTDFLKSDEVLFYKYLSKVNFINTDVSQRYKTMSDKIKNSNYSSSGNINCSVTQNDTSTNVANIQEIFATKYNILQNQNLKQTYADITLSSSNQNIATLRYLKDNNTYAIKADNVVNKYLALENTKLKEFASKIGIEDVSKIPEQLPNESVDEVLKIDDATFNEIKNNYANIIKGKINKNNFNKIKNSNGTITLELSLSEKQSKEIEKAILEQVKNDDKVLNLIIDKMKKIGFEFNIDSMKTSIQENIDEITNGNYSEEKGFFKLAVTENNKDTIKIDLTTTLYEEADTQTTINNQIESNTKKVYNISVDLSDKNKITIITKENEKSNKIVIGFGYNNNSITIALELIELDESYNEKNTKAMLQYQINNYNTEDITQNAIITVNNEDSSKTQISMDNEIQIKEDINIEKITDNNAAILNNKTSEELKNLLYQIQKRIEYLYGEQINMISYKE